MLIVRSGLLSRGVLTMLSDKTDERHVMGISLRLTENNDIDEKDQLSWSESVEMVDEEESERTEYGRRSMDVHLVT